MTLLRSLVRVIQITGLLAFSLAFALFLGLALAELGYLGSCESGECELVAVVYVMPLAGVAFYAAGLIFLSVLAVRRRRYRDTS